MAGAGSDTTVTTVDLLRHGACEGGEIFRGSTDVVLSDAGWQQMRAATGDESGWTQVVSSSLRRCREFAGALAGQQGLPLVVEDDLREIHFGVWEGQPMAQVQRDYPDAWRAFWRSPATAAAPEGESIPDFNQRVLPCMERLLENFAGEHLLVVTHGAVIRAVMCAWLDMPLDAITRLSVPYACLTRFRIYQMAGKKPWLQLCFHRGE